MICFSVFIAVVRAFMAVSRVILSWRIISTAPSTVLGMAVDCPALFRMMRLDLSAPDYTTLSRCSQHLRRRLRLVLPGEGLHLVLDSTGLSIVGAGECTAAKHGGRGRRGWRKLQHGVDQSGVILVHTLTEATDDDASPTMNCVSYSK